MASYTIIHGMDGEWHVHRTGCRDIRKAMGNANGATLREAPDAAAAVAADLDDHDGELRELGYDEGWYHVLPCACK